MAAAADAWVEALGMVPLPDESGWWSERSRSAIEVELDGRRLPASSSIHYLLDAERPVNVWHRLESDDVHVLVDGGPVEYVVWPDEADPFRAVLGRDHAAGQVPVVVAPGGSWKALRLLDADGFALMATVVTPGWTPDRVRVGLPGTDALRLLAQAPWLDPELLERLGRP